MNGIKHLLFLNSYSKCCRSPVLAMTIFEIPRNFWKLKTLTIIHSAGTFLLWIVQILREIGDAAKNDLSN